MVAPTVNVSIQCFGPDGSSISLAEVEAKLTWTDIDDGVGYILPQTLEGTADVSGLLVLPMWPNILGLTGSYYKIRITDPENGKVTKVTASIPNNDCFLHDVSTLPAYPGKPDGQQAADDAAASALEAENSATAAAGSALSALTSETNAGNSASAASSSESNANTSAGNAATSETNAGNSASAASTSEGNASSSASAASTSETNAGNSASAASSSETDAAVSAASADSAASAVGAKFTFDDSVTMDDPGTGDFKFNNATIANVTAIAFDALSADTGNPDLSAFIATWGASTSVNKGQIVFKKKGTPATFAIFNVTAAVVDNTGWLQVTVEHVDSAGSWSALDVSYVQFSRAGDAGDMTASNNLSELTSKPTALTNLGLQGLIGDLGNLLLHMPLMNSLTMVIGVGVGVVTRSLAANYQDRYGVIKSAATDTARYGKDGLLLEDTSDQLFSYPTDFSGTGWSDGSAFTVVHGSTDIYAPDNTSRPSKYTRSGTGGLTVRKSLGGTVILNGESHTISVFVYVPTGSDDITFDVDYDNDSESPTFGITEKDKWVRADTYNTAIADVTNCDLNIRGTGTGNSFYLWFGQLEKKGYPTSPINATSAPVTRPVDLFAIPASENYPNPDDGLTILFDYIPLGDGEDLSLRMFGSNDTRGSNYETRTIGSSSAYGLAVYAEGGVVFSILESAVVRGAKARWGFQLENVGSNVEWVIYKDGIEVGSGSVAGSAGVPDDTFDLGSWGTVADGHYANLRLIPGVLSAETIRVA